MALCENKDASKLNVFQSNLFELYVGFTNQQADTLFVFSIQIFEGDVQEKSVLLPEEDTQFYSSGKHLNCVIDCDHSETMCACCCLFSSEEKNLYDMLKKN